MTSKSQLFRFMIFVFCVLLTFFSCMYFYNYSEELTVNIMKKKLQTMDLEEIQKLLGSAGSNEIKQINDESNPANMLPHIRKAMNNKEFLLGIQELLAKNRKDSKTSEQQNVQSSISPEIKSSVPDQKLSALQTAFADSPKIKNIFDILLLSMNNTLKSSKKSIQTNSSVKSSLQLPKEESTILSQQPSSLPYLGKISAIYESKFLHSPSKICSQNETDLKLLIVVISSPINFNLRQAIRETWGQKSIQKNFKVVFIVGSSNSTIESRIASENKQHDDVICGKFLDSYNNLTLKTVSILDWVNSNCPNAKFILKADDDSFINVQNIFKVISIHENDKKSIYGRIGYGWSPFREPASKYYISYDEFPDPKLPDFATGPAYMMTSDCVRILYEEVLKQNYLKLEDVLVTGIAARNVGITRVFLKEFTNEPNKDLCKLRQMISFHDAGPDDQHKFWKSLSDDNLKCLT